MGQLIHDGILFVIISLVFDKSGSGEFTGAQAKSSQSNQHMTMHKLVPQLYVTFGSQV